MLQKEYYLSGTPKSSKMSDENTVPFTFPANFQPYLQKTPSITSTLSKPPQSTMEKMNSKALPKKDFQETTSRSSVLIDLMHSMEDRNFLLFEVTSQVDRKGIHHCQTVLCLSSEAVRCLNGSSKNSVPPESTCFAIFSSISEVHSSLEGLIRFFSSVSGRFHLASVFSSSKHTKQMPSLYIHTRHASFLEYVQRVQPQAHQCTETSRFLQSSHPLAKLRSTPSGSGFHLAFPLLTDEMVRCTTVPLTFSTTTIPTHTSLLDVFPPTDLSLSESSSSSSSSFLDVVSLSPRTLPSTHSPSGVVDSPDSLTHTHTQTRDLTYTQTLLSLQSLWTKLQVVTQGFRLHFLHCSEAPTRFWKQYVGSFYGTSLNMSTFSFPDFSLFQPLLSPPALSKRTMKRKYSDAEVDYTTYSFSPRVHVQLFQPFTYSLLPLTGHLYIRLLSPAASVCVQSFFTVASSSQVHASPPPQQEQHTELPFPLYSPDKIPFHMFLLLKTVYVLYFLCSKLSTEGSMKWLKEVDVSFDVPGLASFLHVYRKTRIPPLHEDPVLQITCPNNTLSELTTMIVRRTRERYTPFFHACDQVQCMAEENVDLQNHIISFHEQFVYCLSLVGSFPLFFREQEQHVT